MVWRAAECDETRQKDGAYIRPSPHVRQDKTEEIAPPGCGDLREELWPPAVVRRKISPRAHGATRPPARYSVILVPIFVRRCSPFPYVPSPIFLLFAAFNRSALRCSSDSGDGLSGLRQAVNSETLNISDCGKRPAGLHSLTRCWWATRLSIVCRC